MVKKSWKKNEEAVSPIVATLLLVLVTVAAAVGFYAWFGEYQDNTANAAGDVDFADYETLLIAGSSTVYEFSTVGAELFSENYTNYKVSVQSGGSGAGKTSVANGLVDIGSSSSALNDGDKIKWPDMVETIVGYDAIVIVTSATNTHGLISINYTVLKTIYYVNGGGTGWATPAWLTPTGASGKFVWSDIPHTQGVTLSDPKVAAEYCTGSEIISIYDRADHSGTEESFSKDMIRTGKDTIEEVGIITGNSYPTNQEIITKLKVDEHALGFMAYGLAKDTGNGLRMLPFAGSKNTASQVIADPNNAGTFIPRVTSVTYDGARTLVYLTMGEPEGNAKIYIDFVRTPWVNIQICKAAGYVPLYT